MKYIAKSNSVEKIEHNTVEIGLLNEASTFSL